MQGGREGGGVGTVLILVMAQELAGLGEENDRLKKALEVARAEAASTQEALLQVCRQDDLIAFNRWHARIMICFLL